MSLGGSLLILWCGIFNIIFVRAQMKSYSGLPTAQEQGNLLTSVQEVFEQVQLLVKDESKSTDEALTEDVDRMVRRAADTLSLYEELVLNRISVFSNKICSMENKDKIKSIHKDSKGMLRGCFLNCTEDIKSSTLSMANATAVGVNSGQQFLDALELCSRKPAFGLISCYRKVVATEVEAVKRLLLDAIKAHRAEHQRAIEIKNQADNCVDTVVENYKLLMDNELNAALKCTT